MEKIVVLINPKANKKRIEKVVTQISSGLSQQKISFISFEEAWPVEINIYKEVWLIGGDGTLNYFLNFYRKIEIPIVLFKGGTGNDFATKLYGQLNINEQINKIFSSKPKYVD